MTMDYFLFTYFFYHRQGFYRTWPPFYCSVLCFLCVLLTSSCVLCGQCYQCLWFVHFWLSLRFSLTCILTECTWWRIYQKRIVSIKLYLRFYYRAEFSVKNEILFNWSRCDLPQNNPERNGDKDASSQIRVESNQPWKAHMTHYIGH
jgi:hypothetical protein